MFPGGSVTSELDVDQSLNGTEHDLHEKCPIFSTRMKVEKMANYIGLLKSFHYPDYDYVEKSTINHLELAQCVLSCPDDSLCWVSHGDMSL